MIDVSDAVRNAYKTDRYPLREELAKKEFFVKLLESGTIITEDNLESENFTLTESICSDTNVTFGACEASMVSFAVYDISEELNNKWIEIYQTVDGEKVPFGTYKISSVTKRDADPNWRDIVAYDRMTGLDVDVTAWWNSFWENRTNTTAREFRLAFFSYMGFELEEQDLTNDGLSITKSIDPDSIKGRYIAQEIGEINGCFGHFTREDKFKYVSLSGVPLYPSEDLYPDETLYPAEGAEVMSGDNAVYFASESHFEDYSVKAIDSVTFRDSSESTGYTVGDTQDNPYIVEGNFLVYGKTNEELAEIADNLLVMAKNKIYTPNKTVMIGLPYLEVGDSVAIVLDKDAFDSFVFQRTLTGIQNLMDEITATGTEYRRDETSGDDTALLVLKSEVAQNTEDIAQNSEDIEDLQESVDEVTVSLKTTEESIEAEVTRATAAEETLSSKISVTSTEISAEVTRATSAEETLSSRVTLTESGLTSKVSSGDVVSVINQSADKISLSSNRISISSNYFTLTDTGNITATAGSIAGFTFDNNHLYSSSGTEIWANTIYTGNIGLKSGSTATEFDVGNNNAITYIGGTSIKMGGTTTALTVNGASTFNNTSTWHGTLYAGYPIVSTSSNIYRMTISGTSNNTLNVNVGGTSYAYTLTTSDARLKENIVDSTVDAISKLKKVKVRAFDWKSDGSHVEHGMIADEVKLIDDKFAVGGEIDDITGERSYMSIDVLAMLALTIRATQDQQEIIETQESRIAALEADMAILKQAIKTSTEE